MSKKHRSIILVLGALTALGPFSIDMYLPAFPVIAEALHTDIAHVTLSLTSYFVGISVGQLICGPLLDRYGRKKPLIAGLVIYILAAAGCAMVPGVWWLVGMRLLLALGGCVGMVAGRAVVRDIFPAHETAGVFSTLMLVMGIAPIIAPTVGGYVTAFMGWRWIFIVLAIIALLMLLSVTRFLPESKGADDTVSLNLRTVSRQYAEVFRERGFMGYALAGGAASGGMFAYIAGSPFVYMDLFGLSEQQYGWAFGANAFGLIAGSQINRVLLKRYTAVQIAVAMAGVLVLVAAGLTITGILALKWLVMGLVWCFLVCLGFLNPNTTAMALQPFSRTAGSASALLGAIQMVSGALASVAVSMLHNQTIVPMVSVMAGCAAIGLCSLLSVKKQPGIVLQTDANG
jgi:DHA1 family bicyclomycin/chloramphenicol resistance-like MFS transporter